MKAFRVLMVFVFMFATVATSTAQAAGGQKVGFIRLLSSVASNTPIQIQARNAFQRMRPQLLALQKQGVLLAFEPEFKAGIVKIAYADNGASAAALPQYQIFDNIQDAIVRVPNAVRPLAETASPEAISPVFYMELYDECFGAAHLGADSLVVGSLRDKTGRVVASYEGIADSTGDIYMDCFPWSGSYATVLPGYTVTFKVYDLGSTLLGTFSIVAPTASFTAINKTSALVRGTGPAGKPYEIDLYHRNWDALDTWTNTTKVGTITSLKTWAKDVSSSTLRGGDVLDFYISPSSSFMFLRSMVVPAIYCQLGSNYCEISGFAFQPAALTILHMGKKYSFTGTFDADGYFSAELQNVGDPIFLSTGDTISGTGIPAYRLPILKTRVNFSLDIVLGKVPANKYFELWAYTLCSCSSYGVYAHSDAMGSYTGDFYGQVDLIPMDATNIEVLFVDPTTGNTTDYVRSYGP